jgi:salicylate hydroxylase
MTSPSSAGIETAFMAYDAVRRPRCQRVIDSSRGTGEICCGQVPAIGIDPEKLKEALLPRWGFIYGLDLASYKKEALDQMKEIREKCK